uniref:WWE domain-containing protein n=1 Tax=Sphaeramia orbicularis TaxID=375764 RepID=A0A673B9Z3_9TELE
MVLTSTVWEWQDDLGYWRPYSGQVSAYIERCLSPRGQRGGGGPGSTSHLVSDNQTLFRQDTGKPILHFIFIFPSHHFCKAS